MHTVAASVLAANTDHRPAAAAASDTSASDLMDEASAQLQALGGALGVLAGHIERLENVGTDTSLAVYAAGHTVERIREVLRTAIDQTMALEQASR